MNWLDYKKAKGQTINPFDEDNAHVPAEVMPDYEPPPMPPPEPMEVAPFPGDAPPPAPPLAQAEPPPVDLKRFLSPKAQPPGPDVNAARMEDRQRQDQDDLRNLLLQAATRGQSGQLRNLGNPETQFALSQQPKQQDELDRAMKVAQLKKLFEPKERNPFEDELKQAEIDNYKSLKALHDRQGFPAPQKSKIVGAPESDDLTPEEEALLEQKLGLPKGSLANVRRKTVGLIPKKVTAKGGGLTPGGTKIPATVLLELSSYDAADEELGKLEKSYNDKGLGHGVLERARAKGSEMFGLNNDYTQYLDDARRAMQGVGTILEKGKLAAGDETKYRRLLPEPGDSPERTANKIQGLRSYLKSLHEKANKALGKDSAGPKAFGPAEGEMQQDKSGKWWHVFPDGSAEEVDG